MSFFLFVLISSAIASCCLSCSSKSSTGCTTCNSGHYLYNNLICLQSCPSTYSVQGSTCTAPSDPLLFDMDFYKSTNINSRTFNGFSSAYSFRFSNFKSNSLIPTLDRGFLSTSVSVMVSDTSWVPGPDMTFRFWVYPTLSGVIFEVYGSSYTSFSIGVNSNFSLSLRTLNQGTGSTAFTDSFLSSPNSFNAWDLVLISFSQNTAELVAVKLRLNGNEVYYSVSSREASFGYGNTWSFGSYVNGNAFKGFLYKFRADNAVLDSDLQGFSLVNCGPYNYLDGSTCRYCSGDCDWSVCSGSSCSICSGCKYCEGYSKGDCSCGGSTCCQRGCTSCTDFYVCIICGNEYTLVDGICIAKSPLIDVKFTGDFAGYYGKFRTGSDGTRFYYKSNPESVDPIPARYRGLYFTGGAYLVYDDLFTLNQDFTVALWIKPYRGSIFNKGGYIQFDTYRFYFYYKYIYNGYIYSYYTDTVNLNSVWTHLAINFDSKTDHSNYNIYIDNVKILSYSTWYLIFEDLSNTYFTLGKSVGNYYQGFIYSIKLWQMYIQDFAYEFLDEICGESLSSGCLSECPINYYLATNCMPCSNSCSWGCVDQRSTCTICQSYLCQYCDNFETTVCLSCITNASGTPCKCNDGYYEYSYICNACYARCATCANGGHGCLSCVPGYLLTETLCLTDCPTGYTLSSTSCTKSSILALSFDFRQTFSISTINSFTIGRSDLNDYPNFDTNDPWPSAYRGYYFTENKFLTGSFTLSPIHSLSIWLKVLKSGKIIEKSSILTLTALSTSQVEIKVHLMNGNILSQTLSVSDWTYLSFSVYLYTNLIYCKLTSSVNNLMSGVKDLIGFVSDSPSTTLTIGSPTGFTGFIAILNFYTDSSHNSTSYNLACTDSTCSYPLSKCEFNQDPVKNCNNCPSFCTYGCRNGSCSLCPDSLCQTCSDRESYVCSACTQHSNGEPCVCDKFYYDQEGVCFRCYKNCESCFNSTFLCESCGDGMVLNNFYCVNECPTGFDEVDGECVEREILVFDLDLSDVIELGEIQGFVVGNETNNTYPEYDVEDPWPSHKRGYYFAGLGQMHRDLVLAQNFTFALWLLYQSEGVVLEKSSEDSQMVLRVTNETVIVCFDLQGSEVNLSATYNSSEWIYITISIYTDYNSTFLYLFDGTSLVDLQEIDSYFLDSNSSLLLPPTTNNTFTGFIYRISLIQSSTSSPSPSPTTPVPTSTCSILQYPDNCNPCPSSCTHSCASNSCNLCEDKLCEFCTYFTSPCETCKNNSSLLNLVCDCDEGFYLEFESCHLCYPKCKDCDQKYMTSCTMCQSGLILLSDGICGLCGLGFNLTDIICEIQSSVIFNVDFNNTIKGVITDSANGFQVITGKSSKFYPEYEDFDPYVAYLRGFYFNGKSSFMAVSADAFKLPHIFQIKFWINPTGDSGTVFSKGELFIHFSSLYLKTCLNLTDSYLCLDSSTAIISKSWAHILISYSFSSELTSITYNNQINSTKGYIIDNTTQAIFGKRLSFLEGFLYSFTILSGSSPASPARNLQNCNEPCLECLDSGYCIPTCLISQFWVGPAFNNCESCKSECGTGCRSGETCSLCADEKCKSCGSLDIDTECTSCFLNGKANGTCECETGFNWNPTTLECFKCKSNEYVEEFKCFECNLLCKTCRDKLNCLSCVDNAEVMSSMCECQIGYLSSDEGDRCVRHVLNVSVLADQDNQGNLIFNESLKYEIGEEDLMVEVNGDWKVNRFSDRFYKLEVEYSGSVSDGDLMVVKLVNLDKFVSVTNATPEVFVYSVPLTKSPPTANAALEAAKQLAQAVTTAVTSAVTATSMMNPNPACLWSFINTVQMIVFIILANVSIPSKSKGLIIGLKNYNFFPNTFEYFLPEGEPHDFQNAYDLGYKSDSTLINIGRAVTAFAAFMILWVLLLAINLLIKKGYCNKKIIVDNVKEFLADYKYGFFIRYGITNYIEFEIAALIGVINFDNLETFPLVNTIISSFILIVLAATPILCFVMVSKRKAKNKDDQQEFDTMYGTLFYEFNNDKGVMTSNFYVFFFLKRATYGIILMLLRGYGVVQMTLILILSFAFLIYLIAFKPFGEKMLNFSNIFSEVATLLIFILITWLLFDLSDKSLERLDNVIYYLVYAIMGIQMCASVGLMVKTIKNKIDEKRKKSSVSIVVPISSDEHEAKNLNVLSNSNDASRIDINDEARSKKTASGLSKYGKFFEDN